MEYRHIPVMLDEVIKYLDPRPGQNFIDGTLGGGGYTAAIAKRILPAGKVIAIDLDELALSNAREKFKIEIKNIYPRKGENIILAHDNFKNLQKITEENFTPPGGFDGIVFDLGLSGAQLEDRSRGFSFNLPDSPLSMSFKGAGELTAEKIINNWSETELVKIFKEYGEEKFSKSIVKKIIEKRRLKPIKTVGELVEIIKLSVPRRMQSAKIHPATKVFQALRVAVNRELENLQEALPQALGLLKPGGKIVVISYHSLEDRIVKQYTRQEAKDCLCPPAAPVCQCGHEARLKILTKGILRPTEEEVLRNPRARSAKLRAVEKLAPKTE